MCQIRKPPIARNRACGMVASVRDRETGRRMLRSIIVVVLTILITVSLASASGIRGVVTGLDESNRSTTMFDSQVDVKDIRPDLSLALQLLFCFEVVALSGGLVSPSPE
jgi:hypothetical protein